MNIKLARYVASAARQMIRPALVAGVSAAIIAGVAAPAPASAVSRSPSGCDSGYVVQSVPLTNLSTGVASWNYGYVQLWYSNSCGDNWTRVVFKLQNFSLIRADVYGGPNGSYFACGTPYLIEEGCKVNSSTVNGATAVESDGIVSPNDPADMCGGVWIDNNAEPTYAAQWAQSGYKNPPTLPYCA